MTGQDRGPGQPPAEPAGAGPAGPPGWKQLNITFASAGRQATEHAAVTHLGPALASAENQELIAGWFFIRKQPWKLRYLPVSGDTAPPVAELLHAAATSLLEAGHATSWCHGIYEPETCAFGGHDGMRAAHALFHADSRHIFRYVAPSAQSHAAADAPDQRRELSVLLCTALMRAAGLDRYERGDTWARIARTRPASTVPADRQDSYNTAIEHLITTDTSPATPLRQRGLRHASDWLADFEHAGQALRTLADEGQLTRGLRAVIAHHVIFHWNRIGLPAQDQANIARAATQVTFR